MNNLLEINNYRHFQGGDKIINISGKILEF